MRVFILAPHFAEYSFRFAIGLSEFATVKLAVDVDNMQREMDGLCLRPPEKMKVEHYRFQKKRSKLQKYFDFFPLILSVIKFRPDILHVQEVPDPIIEILIGIFRHWCRVVLTVHDPVSHSGSDSNRLQRVRRRQDRMRKAADLILVHGQYCRDAFTALYPRSRVVDVRHGVILEPSSSQKRAPISGRILFFGRMEAYKGLDTLIAAAEHLRSTDVHFSLAIAGHGPELDRLMPTLENLPEAIVARHYHKPEEAIAAFQSSELVVLPYHDATQSGVIAAALANGRPIVASRVGGIPDAVTDEMEALLVPPGDPLALATAIAAVLSSKGLWTKMADHAGRAASGALTWRCIAREVMAEYERVLW